VMSQLQLGPLYTPPSLKGTLQRPGLEGGADWGGGAFDPESATLYVKVNDAPEIVYPDITDANGNVPAVGPNDSSEMSVYLRHRIPLLKPPYADLDAVDLAHGTMRWQVPFGTILLFGGIKPWQMRRCRRSWGCRQRRRSWHPWRVNIRRRLIWRSTPSTLRQARCLASTIRMASKQPGHR
jgi:hypothetical protein